MIPPFDAPLWRPATPEQITDIVSHLSQASFHYADDSASEWGDARAQVKLAAQKINEIGLCFEAIRYLHQIRPQLVSFDALMNAVLSDARGK